MMNKLHSLIAFMVLLHLPLTAQWKAINNGLSHTFVTALASTNSTIVVGTIEGGVFTSTTSGESWNKSEGTSSFIYSLNTKGDTVYAGGDKGNVYIQPNSLTPWLTSNVVSVTAEDIWDICVVENKIFVGTSSDGIYRSTNNGITWTKMNKGFAISPAVERIVYNNGILFAATNHQGVYKSTNQGELWEEANNGLEGMQIKELTILGSRIFAGTWGNGIRVSTDNGASWISQNQGLSTKGRFIDALISTAGYVIAGTSDGVFVSSNLGATWVSANNGLTDKNVEALLVKGTTIYAGTWDGIFKAELNSIITSVDEKNSIDQSTISIYPNPTSDWLHIPCTHNGNVSVYSTTGEVVGVYTCSTDNKVLLSNLVSGMYYVCFKSANGTVTQPLTIIR